MVHPASYPPSTLTDLAEPLSVTLIGLVVVLTVLGGLAYRRLGRIDLLFGPAALGATQEGLAHFYALAPAILGLHIAVPLLVNGVNGNLFSPNNDLHAISLLGVVETGIAIAIFYGAFTRIAAMMLGVLWIGSIFLIGLEPALENIHYLGFALFFFLAGRGPVSIDRLLFPRLEPDPRYIPYAWPALRIAVGASLVVVACSEKLMNLHLAQSFLQRHPLNFLPALGIPMSDHDFAICAGSAELLFGLWVIFGIFPRLLVLALWLPFNLTLTIFDSVELVGHLPYYGFLAILFVCGGPKLEAGLWRRALRETIYPVPAQRAQ